MKRLFFAHSHETTLALFSILWGALLILPNWIDYSRPAYVVMAAFAPAAIWGALMCGGGGLLLWALYALRQWWRKRALSLLFVLWLAVGCCLGLPNPHSTAFLTYFFVATMAGIAHMRAGAGGQQ